MKSYIAETKSGKLFEFKLADNAEDGWGCKFDHWQRQDKFDASENNYDYEIVWASNEDVNGQKVQKRGWLVWYAPLNAAMPNVSELFRFWCWFMRDPIITIFDESLTPILAEEFLAEHNLTIKDVSKQYIQG